MFHFENSSEKLNIRVTNNIISLMERFLSICHVQFASYLTHVRSYISFVNKNKKQTWKKKKLDNISQSRENINNSYVQFSKIA